MRAASPYSSDVAFTPSVKAVQERKGSRQGYARIEERGGWRTRITPIWPHSSRRKPASFSPPPPPMRSPTSSIAAGLPASCGSWTRRPSASSILPVIGSTSRRAI